MGKRMNRQTIYSDFCNKMFKGDAEKCKEWFYHTNIEGVGMTMDEMTRVTRGWVEAKAFLIGYLAGKEGKYD